VLEAPPPVAWPLIGVPLVLLVGTVVLVEAPAMSQLPPVRLELSVVPGAVALATASAIRLWPLELTGK